MLFNSTAFLFLFLPIVYGLYWRVARGQRARLFLLTLASYLFYAYSDWRFTILLFGVTLISYVTGARMHAAQLAGNGPGARRWLVIGVGAPLALLGFFKYADFTVQSVNEALELLVPVAPDIPLPHVPLPIGISFFTFQALSYIIDLYQRKVTVASSLLQMMAYIALFPQLIAGPIVRYKTLAPQLDALPRKLTDDRLFNGLVIFILGLAKKILIADSIGAIINPLLDGYTELQLIGAWGAMLGYTFQLYFDFSAYSEMAIGLGHWLGLDLPINFNRPYCSHNISEFWERWHITLSGWIRHYIYFPLGGNRKSAARTLANLLVAMFLGGLWHGAGWTFVLWGLYHGMLLVIYHVTCPYNLIRWRPLSWLLTFVGVVFGWVLFRAETFEMAAHLAGSMIGFHGFDGLGALDNVLGLRLVGLLAICAFIEWRLPPVYMMGVQPDTASVPSRSGWFGIVARVAVLVMLFVASVASLDNAQQFLYFRF